MKCPKCGFIGSDRVNTCKKCGKDLTGEKQKLGLTFFQVKDFRPRQTQKMKPSPELSTAGSVFEEPLEADQKGQEPPGVLKISTETQSSPMDEPPMEATSEEVENDFDFPQEPADVKPDHQKESSFESLESDFQFQSEKEASSSTLAEATLGSGEMVEDSGQSEEAEDDFDFPEISKSDLPTDTASSGNDDLSMLSELDMESESFDLPTTDDKDDVSSEDGGILSNENALSASEFTSGEDDEKLTADELLPLESEQAEKSETVMLHPEEIEDILQSEISQSDKSSSRTIHEGSKTELLDENEISKLLEELDADTPNSDKNPE